MIDIYFDCETTGLHVYENEMITAYFKAYKNGEFYDDYEFYSQVNKWEHEAEQIHNITMTQSQMFPPKQQAFRQLLDWLPSRFRFITYTNTNTMQGSINFDVAILKNELNLLGYDLYHLENEYKMSKPITVYDLAKECAKKGYFIPLKGESGRVSYSQENVFKALFNESYDAHNAIDDVNALVKIHKKLLSFEGETLPLFREY